MPGISRVRRGEFADHVDPVTSDPLCVKYIAPAYARQYLVPGRQLRISDSAGFTWGRGLYVTPLRYPISSAIFGRVGVVGRFSPSGWKFFDATKPANQDLYLQWSSYQPVFRTLALTMHANLANQSLRDMFRETFQIDAVLFGPDQSHRAYTNRSDVWMAISAWQAAGRLKRRGFSDLVGDTWAAVIIEDEFEDSFGGIGRRRLLGPLMQQQDPAVLADLIAEAWEARPAAEQIRIGA